MASVALADGGGKAVKTDSTWSWVKSLESGSSALKVNAEKIGGVIDDVSSVITSIFGGSEKKNDAVSNDASLVPLLALGGGLALLLK